MQRRHRIRADAQRRRDLAILEIFQTQPQDFFLALAQPGEQSRQVALSILLYSAADPVQGGHRNFARQPPRHHAHGLAAHHGECPGAVVGDDFACQQLAV